MIERLVQGAVVAATLATATVGLATAPAQAAGSGSVHCDSITGRAVWSQDCSAPTREPVARAYSVYIAKCVAMNGSTDGSFGPTPRSGDHWVARVVCFREDGFR